MWTADNALGHKVRVRVEVTDMSPSSVSRWTDLNCPAARKHRSTRFQLTMFSTDNELIERRVRSVFWDQYSRGHSVVYSPQGRCAPRWRRAGWCRCWGLLLWSSGRRGCRSSYSSGSSAASFSTSGSRPPPPSPAALSRVTDGREQTITDWVSGMMCTCVLRQVHLCVFW